MKILIRFILQVDLDISLTSKRQYRSDCFRKNVQEKITAVGNSSLQGAKKSLETDDAKARWESLVRHSEEIELASSKEFQELYMEHMLFPEE